MQSRTATFDAAIGGSHRVAVTVDVLYNRLPFLTGLGATDGSVTIDRTAAQRGRCDITFAEPLLMPTTTGGALTPYGYELFVRRGVRYSDGSTELLPLGVFAIQRAQIDGVSLTTAVSGVDRSEVVADARFEDDYVIAAGVAYGAAIQAMIADGVPGLSYTFATTAYVTPALTFAAQADRWAAAQGMAKAIGCELFFDGIGTCVMRAEPTFSAVPVWSLVEGAQGLLISAELSLDRADSYNRVVATGENTSQTTIPRGVWTDTDAASPTVYTGGFGHKPQFYSSPYITTDAQALAAATAIGQAQKGIARSLTFSAVPHPGLEPGDVVTVTRTALGLNELHLIDSLTFALDASGAMSGTSRAGSVA